MDKITSWTNKITSEIDKTLKFSDGLLEQIYISFLSNGHLLLCGNSGLGKSAIASNFSACTGLHFRRIFCNSDIQPMDLRGTSIYSDSKKRILYKKGPIQTNILILEDINRLNRRTQSSLIEIMNRNSILIDGKYINRPEPFIVIGTINKNEQEGVFPLSSRFVNSFFMSIKLEYPTNNIERFIMEGEKSSINEGVSDLAEISSIKEQINNCNISDSILNYILDITEALNKNNKLKGTLGITVCNDIIKGSKTKAIMQGRNYVLPEDIQVLLLPLLKHRIALKDTFDAKKLTIEYLLKDILSSIRVPEEKRV